MSTGERSPDEQPTEDQRDPAREFVDTLIDMMEYSESGVCAARTSIEHIEAIEDTLAANRDLMGVEEQDIRTAGPEGARWNVQEVTNLCAIPAQLPAGRSWVIVVEDAANMDPKTAVRLLRTVEEPQSSCWWVLLYDPIGELSPALRGRVSMEYKFPTGDPAAALSKAAEQAGLSEEVTRLTRTALTGDNPIDVATARVSEIRRVAEKLRPKPPGIWTRVMCGVLLNSLTAEIKRTVHAAHPAALEVAAETAVREKVAREALARYAAPEALIASVHESQSKYHQMLARQREEASTT